MAACAIGIGQRLTRCCAREHQNDDDTGEEEAYVSGTRPADQILGHQLLASNFAGERDNAEAQATRILQKVGLTLAEYQASQKQVAVAQEVQMPSQQAPANWRDIIKFC